MKSPVLYVTSKRIPMRPCWAVSVYLAPLTIVARAKNLRLCYCLGLSTSGLDWQHRRTEFQGRTKQIELPKTLALVEPSNP